MAPVRLACKVVLLGEPMVGKTSLIRRFVQNDFRSDYLKTLGAMVSKRTDRLTTEDGREIDFVAMVWDVMGQHGPFQLMKDAYFFTAKGAIVVFDLTRRETFQTIPHWVEAAQGEDPHMPMVVLGNKCDLAEQRQVEDEEVLRWCTVNNLRYMTTSAKTGQNVEEAFHHLEAGILHRWVATQALAP